MDRAARELVETYMREVVGPISRRLVDEAIRRERERRNPVNRAGRALHGLWRTIATGGWE